MVTVSVWSRVAVEMDPACSTPAVAVGKGGAEEIPRDTPIVGQPVVALLTAAGRSALAVVGMFGGGSVEVLSSWFRPKGRPLVDRDAGQIVFGRWGLVEPGGGPTAGGIPPEDLVVVKRSSTSFEIHPHGGLAASSRVLSDLESAGCRRLSWPEWLAATGCSEIEVEARLALSQTTCPKAAAILCRQLSSGLLESEIDGIRRFAAEGNAAEAARRVDRLLAWAPLGLRLARPWRVVVAGRPNAGKSSLVNALAGFARSLVSSEPGTTRDLVATRIVLDGWEIDLVDTAGLRDDPSGPIEQAGIDRAREAALSADLVLDVRDAGDFSVTADKREERRKSLPFLTIFAKVDLPSVVIVAERSSRSELPADAIRTSTVTGEGIDTLAAAIVHRLVPHEPGSLDAVPFTSRQVAEIQSMVRR
jgi:tRNA modification GTPase